MSNRLPLQDLLTNDHLCAIGLAIAEWAKTERTIYLTFTQVAGWRSQAEEMSQGTVVAMLLAAGLEPRTAIGILKAIIRATNESKATEFDKLCNRFERLYKRRNVIAHGAWLRGSRPGSIKAQTVKSVGDVRIERHDYTALEILAVAHRIHAFRKDFIKFFREIGYWKRKHETSPDIDEPPIPLPHSPGQNPEIDDLATTDGKS